MRTKNQIELIKSRITDPYAVESFLTKDETTDLIELFEKTQEGKIYKNTGPITLNLDLNDPIISNILNRLKLEIGNFEVTAAFFFYTETPHIIHNDDTFELPDVYKGITLPLKIEGTSIPKLCFFKQFYFGGPAKFFYGSTDIPTFYNTCLYDYKEVDGLTSELFIDKWDYFTHLKSQWLTGLSLDSVLEWIPGNALIFDSTRLHCSSNFKKQGIKSKLGISIFTKR